MDLDITKLLKEAHRFAKMSGHNYCIVQRDNSYKIVDESLTKKSDIISYKTIEGIYNNVSFKDIIVKQVLGDLLLAEEKYIIHQCNCVSTTAGGLAYHLFKKFPYADVYSERNSGEVDEKGRSILLYKDKPGTNKICGNGIDKRYVINAFSQYYPGGQNNYSNDNELKRLEYFQSCLDDLKKIKNLDSIAFPYEYGCGIAGGNWSVYKELIVNFAIDVDAMVKIIRLPNG